MTPGGRPGSRPATARVVARVGARVVAVGVAVGVAVVALSGCSSQQETYCASVEEHQPALTEAAASEDAGAVFAVLDVYRTLADEAPDDVAQEWDTVVRAFTDLEAALDAADVDPSTYAADDPPQGLTRDERRAIERAARSLGARTTVEAMASVEQHALDVCGTPLSR